MKGIKGNNMKDKEFEKITRSIILGENHIHKLMDKELPVLWNTRANPDDKPDAIILQELSSRLTLLRSSWSFVQYAIVKYSGPERTSNPIRDNANSIMVTIADDVGEVLLSIVEIEKRLNEALALDLINEASTRTEDDDD